MHDNAGENITRSICPICYKVIPAMIRDSTNGALMEKTCPDHGQWSVVVSTDVNTYEKLGRTERKIKRPLKHNASTVHGCPYDCGLCAVHDQHTCLAIMEITSRCDAACPVCISSSDLEGKDMEIAEVESALKTLIHCEGDVTPLQLSGGEPALHGDLQEIVRRPASLGFTKIEMDTNGIRLGRERFLSEQLKEAGLSGVYLQMDGTDPKILETIRGRNLLEEKLRAIEHCKKRELQIVLSVTVVPGINDNCLWEMVKFGVENRLTGVNFQAVSLSGRFPESLAQSPDRFTLGHFVQAMEQQSEGMLLASDLTPIPCPDGRCGVMSYILVQQGVLVPLRRIVNDKVLFSNIADLNDWDTVIKNITCLEEIPCHCGNCGTASLIDTSDLSRHIKDSDYFSVGFHGMMDAYNFDVDRVRKCCVHALTPDGKLMPFCLSKIRRPGLITGAADFPAFEDRCVPPCT